MVPLKSNDLPNLNNPIKFFNINIILHHAFSLNAYEYPRYHQHQYYHNQLKNHTHSHIVFYMFSTVKAIEILPKHNGDAFIWESCVTNWSDFYSIYKQETVASILM